MSKFERLLAQHSDEIFQHCKINCRFRYDPHDAYQECSIKLWKEFKDDIDSDEFMTWAKRKITNHIKNLVKRPKRKPHLVYRPNIQETLLRVENELLDKEERELLYGAISRLPELYHDTVNAVYLEGMTVDQVAEQHEVTKACIRKRLVKAKELILKDLIDVR